MTLNLTPEGDRYIKQAVEQGTYSSELQALEEAIALLKQRDELRADVVAGIRQADSEPLLPAEFVFERLEARARQIETQARGCR